MKAKDLTCLKEVHPTGVEPVTFGSVVPRTIHVIPMPVETSNDTPANLPLNLPLDLEKIVAAWPTLSEPIKAAIQAIVASVAGNV